MFQHADRASFLQICVTGWIWLYRQKRNPVVFLLLSSQPTNLMLHTQKWTSSPHGAMPSSNKHFRRWQCLLHYWQVCCCSMMLSFLCFLLPVRIPQITVGHSDVQPLLFLWKNTLAHAVSLAKVVNLFTKETVTLSSVPEHEILQCSWIWLATNHTVGSSFCKVDVVMWVVRNWEVSLCYISLLRWEWSWEAACQSSY